MADVVVTKAWLVRCIGPHLEQRWAERFGLRDIAEKYAALWAENHGFVEDGTAWRDGDGNRIEIWREVERVEAVPA